MSTGNHTQEFQRTEERVPENRSDIKFSVTGWDGKSGGANAAGAASLNFSDHLEETTATVTAEQWKRQQQANYHELLEFEQIERQVEMGSSLALTTSRGLSAPIIAQRPKPHVPVDRSQESVESDGGWGDAQEYGSQERAVVPEQQGWGHSARPASAPVYTASTAAAGAEEDFGDDDHMSESYNQTMPHSYGDYSGKHARVVDDMEAEDYGEDEEWARSPSVGVLATKSAAGRSSSPNAGSTARLGAQHAGTTSLRTAESPSWGRVTQPVQNSFDSEQDDPPRDPRSSSSAYGQPPAPPSSTVNSSSSQSTVRMSESTLRKISSRTAALQQSHRPTLERPVLADDTSGDRHNSNNNNGYDHGGGSGAWERDNNAPAAVRPAPVSRPLSAQRRLANTMTAAAPPNRARSAGRGSGAAGRGAGRTTTAAEFTQDILEEKARELEEEIQTYRWAAKLPSAISFPLFFLATIV